MSQETELERLVVRLVGDGSSYLKMLQEAQQETKQVEQNLGDLGRAFAGAVAAAGIKEFLDTSLHAWDEQERALIQLEATLKANDRDVKALSADYSEWASRMQELTERGDETNLTLVRMAEQFDLSGAAAKGAAQDAIALAAASGSAAESMLRLTAAMAEGDTERAMLFARMVPQLRGVKDPGEFEARYQKLVAAGWEATIRNAETATGRINQAENAWGDFKEQVGETVAGPVASAAQAIKELSVDIQGMDPDLRKLVVGAMAAAAAMAALASAQTVANMTGLAGATKNLVTALVTNPFVWAAGAAVAVANLTTALRSTGEELDRINDQLERNKEFWTKNAAGIVSEGGERIAEMRGAPEKLAAEEARVREQLERAQASLARTREGQENRIVRGVVQAWLAAGGSAPEFQEQQAAVAGLNKEVAAYKKLLDEIAAAQARLAAAGKPQIGGGAGSLGGAALGAVAGVAERAKKMIEEANEAKKFMEEYWADAAAVQAEFEDPAVKLANRLAYLQGIYESGALSVDAYRRATEAATNAINEQRAALGDAVEAGSAAHLRMQRDMYGTTPERGKFMGGFWGHGEGRGGPGPIEAGAEKGRWQEGMGAGEWWNAGAGKDGGAAAVLDRLDQLIGAARDQGTVRIDVAGLP